MHIGQLREFLKQVSLIKDDIYWNKAKQKKLVNQQSPAIRSINYMQNGI